MAQHQVICSHVHLCFAPRFPARSRRHNSLTNESPVQISFSSLWSKHRLILRYYNWPYTPISKKSSWSETKKKKKEQWWSYCKTGICHKTAHPLHPDCSPTKAQTSTPSQSTRLSPVGHSISQPLSAYPQNQAKDSICLQAFGSDCRQWL